MAHWAKINDEGVVENVIVTSNEEADEGKSWIAENLEGTWIKTSYNTRKNVHLLGGIPLRKNFAQPGFTYDADLDAFIPPKGQGEDDFVLDPETATWIPPVPAPEDADFVLGYGLEPELIEQEVEVDGNTVKLIKPNIPDGSKVYFWIPEQSIWGMASNIPKPEGDFIWDPVAKEWIEPEMPMGPTE